MLVGLYIVVEDDFAAPLHADPDPDELDDLVWNTLRERIVEALEGEGPVRGHEAVGEVEIAWHTLRRDGVTFAAVASDVPPAELKTFLADVHRRVEDEVDDLRDPEAGLADVIVDVIPPWED